jgi:3-hydroxyisobutyrate dehydrogenase-like beta-hydroxyacid dehydrogenase
VALAQKDMALAADLARANGIAMPQGAATLNILSKAKADGFADRDMAAILNYMRETNA